MEELDVRRWCVPFYLDFLHGNFLRIDGVYSAASSHRRSWDEWRALLRHELGEITPEIVGDLIMDVDWRTQICGAYFCGIKRWDQFALDIGRRLVAKRNGFATQGYAFALARMPSHASANYLCGYLSRVGHHDDPTNWYGGDLEWVLAALEWVDVQMNTRRLEPYIELLVPVWQKQRFDNLTKEYRDITLHHSSYEEGMHVGEHRLAYLEKQLDSYFLPDAGSFQNEWFKKLMAFCEKHFDATAA